MRYLVLLLLTPCLFCQAVAPFNSYSHYTLMLVSADKSTTGVIPVITPDRKLDFVPIPDIAKAVNGGASPIQYGDLLQLLQQVNDENVRLKAENERLWKLAEKPNSPATPVVIQQTPVDNSASDRRVAQMMMLRSLLVQPPPLTIYQPSRLHTNCMSRTVGTMVYTDCN